MRGQCVGVVSGKGGTGKTSFAAGAASALALRGRRVLCLDCDVGLRNLDLAMGLTDRAVMDFTDVAAARCTLEEAVVEHPRLPGLFLLNAPAGGRSDEASEESIRVLLNAVREQFDFCFLDAPAGLGPGFDLATCGADRVVVITVSDPAALRDAQHTVMRLDRFPQGTVHLVVNRMRRKLMRGARATIDDAMDQAGLPLLGVVPEDDALPLALSRETPLVLFAPQSPAARAYRNIAARMLGEYTPLPRHMR
ncbi:MAG: P-loop NTPase [Oscillibacter sp.]|nr:P-loop NTPase [Oscillibacter sp.]